MEFSHLQGIHKQTKNLDKSEILIVVKCIYE